MSSKKLSFHNIVPNLKKEAYYGLMKNSATGFAPILIIALITGILSFVGGGYVVINYYKEKTEQQRKFEDEKESRLNELQAKLNQLISSQASSIEQMDESTSSTTKGFDNNEEMIKSLQKEMEELKNSKKNAVPYGTQNKSSTQNEFNSSATQSFSGTEISKKVSPAVALVTNSKGHGSGFFINSSGELLTNEHVIGQDEIVKVKVGTNYYWGKVLGTSYIYDVALIKIEGVSTPYVILGNSDELENPTGSDIYEFGFPLDLIEGDVTMTKGTISARRTYSGGNTTVQYIQTDASTHPGSSGGPLINSRGEVIGINSAGKHSLDTGGNSIGGTGINWAIPINLVKILINDLRNQQQILNAQCKSRFGQQSYLQKKDEIGNPVCQCVEGFKLNDQKTSCVEDFVWWCQENNPGMYTQVQIYSNDIFSCTCYSSPDPITRAQLGCLKRTK